MIEIISAALGFLGSAIPEAVNYFKKKQENKQKLKMLDKEMKLQELTNNHELTVMDKQAANNLQAHKMDIEQIDVRGSNLYDQTLVETHKEEIKKDDWVGKLIRSVRPVLAYSFFTLYSAMKTILVIAAIQESVTLTELVPIVWTQTDYSIFITIICYFFGKRTFEKMSEKK